MLNKERKVVLDIIRERCRINAKWCCFKQTAVIEICIKRIHEEYEGNPEKTIALEEIYGTILSIVY